MCRFIHPECKEKTTHFQVPILNFALQRENNTATKARKLRRYKTRFYNFSRWLQCHACHYFLGGPRAAVKKGMMHQYSTNYDPYTNSQNSSTNLRHWEKRGMSVTYFTLDRSLYLRAGLSPNSFTACWKTSNTVLGSRAAEPSVPTLIGSSS